MKVVSLTLTTNSKTTVSVVNVLRCCPRFLHCCGQHNTALRVYSQLHNMLGWTAFVTGIMRGHGHEKVCQDIIEEQRGSQIN
jgi:hypothetical protein